MHLGLAELPRWVSPTITLMICMVVVLVWLVSRRAHYEKLCRNKILCHFIRPADDITALYPIDEVIEGIGIIETFTEDKRDKQVKDGKPVYYIVPEATRPSTYPQSGFMARFGVKVQKITFVEGNPFPLLALAGELSVPEEFSSQMVGKLRDEKWTEQTVAQSQEETRLSEKLKQAINPNLVYGLLMGCVVAVCIVGYLVYTSQTLNVKTLESIQETLSILRAAQGV